jgi:hypothetical protein
VTILRREQLPATLLPVTLAPFDVGEQLRAELPDYDERLHAQQQRLAEAAAAGWADADAAHADALARAGAFHAAATDWARQQTPQVWQDELDAALQAALLAQVRARFADEATLILPIARLLVHDAARLGEPLLLRSWVGAVEVLRDHAAELVEQAGLPITLRADPGLQAGDLRLEGRLGGRNALLETRLRLLLHS